MEGDVVSIVINGKNEKISVGMTVWSLLQLKGINPNVVACELNMKIVKRADLANNTLKENDHLEIIQMIGGG